MAGDKSKSDTPRKTPKPYVERCKFILAWLKDSVGGCDVLNAEFVVQYLLFCDGIGYYPMPYGAHKVPQLGRDLQRMFREHKLSRCRIGIRGMGGMSFPKWVYNYTIAPRFKEVADLIVAKYVAETDSTEVTR